jgi:hypothetical protein
LSVPQANGFGGYANAATRRSHRPDARLDLSLLCGTSINHWFRWKDHVRRALGGLWLAFCAVFANEDKLFPETGLYELGIRQAKRILGGATMRPIGHGVGGGYLSQFCQEPIAQLSRLVGR